MFEVTAPHPIFRFGILSFFKRRRTGRRDPDSPEDNRARRAFIREMMARNPDAFSSDLDVQAMMGAYPGQY